MLAKKIGAKMNPTNCSIIVRVWARRCVESPRDTPKIKAPKMAWMPIHSVKAAQAKAPVTVNPSTPPG
jgi:hypothetical protein